MITLPADRLSESDKRLHARWLEYIAPHGIDKHVEYLAWKAVDPGTTSYQLHELGFWVGRAASKCHFINSAIVSRLQSYSDKVTPDDIIEVLRQIGICERVWLWENYPGSPGFKVRAEEDPSLLTGTRPPAPAAEGDSKLICQGPVTPNLLVKVRRALNPNSWRLYRRKPSLV